MLTTARKIEIAEAVMNDPRLGKPWSGEELFFRPMGICFITSTILKYEDLEMFREHLVGFAKRVKVYRGYGEYWFNSNDHELARTERIEFLKKYIEHLKKEL